MQRDHKGHSFVAEKKPAAKMPGVIDVVISHIKPSEKKVQTTEHRQVMQERTTAKKDTKGKAIIERVPVMEEITVESTVIETTQVEVGSFTIYADVDHKTLRKMVANWLEYSADVRKITK